VEGVRTGAHDDAALDAWVCCNMFAADVYKLFEGTADAAFVVTLDGEICFWNGAAERLFGYTAADVRNKTCYDVLKGKGALGTVVCTGDCSVQRCAVHTESIPTFDLEVTTCSGKRRWISVSTIVFEDSRLHRRLIVHLSHDISKRKEAERTFAKMMELSKQVVSIGESQSRPAPIELLSEQEQRILTLFAKAMNSGQVAKELGITLPTLRNHLHAINQKLRTHNRLEAVLHAMKRVLI
jgi:PAS domain S-box-containing protein